MVFVKQSQASIVMYINKLDMKIVHQSIWQLCCSQVCTPSPSQLSNQFFDVNSNTYFSIVQVHYQDDQLCLLLLDWTIIWNIIEVTSVYLVSNGVMQYCILSTYNQEFTYNQNHVHQVFFKHHQLIQKNAASSIT